MPPEGYGKFELNVHSNDCYTAGGPSKLTGFLTITDTHGRRGHQPRLRVRRLLRPARGQQPHRRRVPLAARRRQHERQHPTPRAVPASRSAAAPATAAAPAPSRSPRETRASEPSLPDGRGVHQDAPDPRAVPTGAAEIDFTLAQTPASGRPSPRRSPSSAASRGPRDACLSRRRRGRLRGALGALGALPRGRPPEAGLVHRRRDDDGARHGDRARRVGPGRGWRRRSPSSAPCWSASPGHCSARSAGPCPSSRPPVAHRVRGHDGGLATLP